MRKKNEVLPFTAKLMELEDIVSSYYIKQNYHTENCYVFSHLWKLGTTIFESEIDCELGKGTREALGKEAGWI